MEIKCHVTDTIFYNKLEPILDSLANLYSKDTAKFIEVWKTMPQALRMGITNTAANSDSFRNTIYEDIADYCKEVTSWYRIEIYTTQPEKAFTLRNPDDLIQFEEFLDRMLYLKDLSPKHFITYLEQCPTAYWDKIDDLRETSFKLQRDSEEYLRCLEKCKIISFSYSEIVDLLTKNEENEEEDYYDDEDDFGY